jgi:hypothetical protein
MSTGLSIWRQRHITRRESRWVNDRLRLESDACLDTAAM